MLSAVPGWLQILQAAGAVLGGSGALVALVVLLRDRRRYRSEKLGREVQQARGVVVLVQTDGDVRTTWSVTAVNYSSAVILDVTVDPPPNVLDTGWHLSARHSGWFNPDGGREVMQPDGILDVGYVAIGPTGAATSTTAGDQYQATETNVHFTDAAGLRWSRTGSAQPVKRDDDSQQPRRLAWLPRSGRRSRG